MTLCVLAVSFRRLKWSVTSAQKGRSSMSIKLQLSILVLAMVQAAMLVFGAFLAPAVPVATFAMTLALVGVSALVSSARQANHGVARSRRSRL
jgi:hypothetical protein